MPKNLTTSFLIGTATYTAYGNTENIFKIALLISVKIENKSHNIIYCSLLQTVISNNFSEIESTFLTPTWNYMETVDSFCLLNEEFCSRLSFNTDISKNPIKEIWTTCAKGFGYSAKDLYFSRVHDGSRNILLNKGEEILFFCFPYSAAETCLYELNILRNNEMVLTKCQRNLAFLQ